MFGRNNNLIENENGTTRVGLFKRLKNSVSLERENLLLITLVFFFVTSLGVVWYLNGGNNVIQTSSSQSQDETEVLKLENSGRTIQASTKRLNVRVKTTGIVRALKTVSITAPSAGSVTALPAIVGTNVTSSTVFLKLDTTALQKDADQKKALYDLAQAQVVRLQQLAPPAKAIDITIAQLNADIAMNNYNAALAAVVNTEIKFPSTGILDTLSISQGQRITINQLLGTVVSPDDYVIEAWLSPEDAALIETATEANVDFLSRPGVAFKASILSIGKTANDTAPGQGTTIPILLKLAPDTEPLDFLRTGLYGVNIQIDTFKDVITVPESSVIEKDGKKLVYLVGKNKSLIAQEVKTGSSDEEDIEIIEGLNGTETIALSDLEALKTLK